MRVAETDGVVRIGHTGGWVAFGSLYYRYPELNLSVVVMCNSTEVSAARLGSQVVRLAVASVTGAE